MSVNLTPWSPKLNQTLRIKKKVKKSKENNNKNKLDLPRCSNKFF